jgi:carbonic anhydrase/acetyltransferase-like protein (isoleucine patch superfamily)
MIYKFNNEYPVINKDSFVAESADIIGDVTICENVSIWFGAVIRGDINPIFIGKGTNVQDNCVLHTRTGDNKIWIGQNVTIGHSAVIHGATIGSYSLIGMGSIILDDAQIGNYTIIGAGSLVPSGKKIPDGVLCLGSPAKIIRELTPEEKRGLENSAATYMELYKKY